MCHRLEKEGHMSDDLNYTLRCEFCGQETSDYWYSVKSRGICRCRSCLASGISQTVQEKNRLSRFRFNPSYFSISPEKTYSDHEQKIGFEKKHSIEEKDSQKVAARGCPSGVHRVSTVVPLSTAHKSPFEADSGDLQTFSPDLGVPFVQWSAGASLLKVSKNESQVQNGGGRRGVIKGFSRGSRRRLMQKIARVKRDAELPCFMTLTYPFVFPSPSDSKRHLDIFIKRLLRSFPQIGFIWKLEPQERGAPHYHFLVWGVDVLELFDFVVPAWFDIAGGGDENHFKFHYGLLHDSKPCVERVRSFRGVWSYASKYLGKTFDVAEWGEKWTGRFWAVVNPQNIPFGEDCIFPLSRFQSVHFMRYQKRFSKAKKRNYPSLTTFCDADQWIKNLMRDEVAKHD